MRRGTFSPEAPDRFRDLVDALLDFDPFMVAADFDAYWTAQRAVDNLWKQPECLVARLHHDDSPNGLVLLRPHDPRIRRRDMECRQLSAGRR